MTTQNKTSNERKIEKPASVKLRTHKNESPLKPEEKTTSNKSQSLLRYGVENGEIIADQLIRANCEVCIFWLDAVRQFRKTNLEKMVLVEETGQLVDQMAHGLLEAGTNHAHNAVRQVAEIANTGISNFEEMQMEKVSLFNFGRVLPSKVRS